MGHQSSRREFLKRTAFLGCGTLLSGCETLFPDRVSTSDSRDLDVIIENGTLIDGTGSPPFGADVGIRSDRVAAIGALQGRRAGRRIDGSGLIVAPGFIDIHSHSDLLENPRAESKVRQGVTTDIIGPDGGSSFPQRRERYGENPPPVKSRNECTNYNEWAALFGKPPSIAINLGSYVGFGAIRSLVMGDSPRQPTARELAVMKDLAREAMAQGALGLSSGLEYFPGGFAKTEEIIEVAKAAAEYAGVYSTHMRSEDRGVLSAIDEAILISRESGLRLLVTHFKISGPPNWHMIDEAIDKLERARDEGLAVYCDRYPYLAWNTGFSYFYPTWAKENGRLLENLKDPATREKMKAATLDLVDVNGGWDALMISAAVSKEDPSLTGRRISEIARDRGVDPYEFVCNQMLKGSVRIIGFAMSEENTARIIALPYCAIASDGSALPASSNPEGHPRSFGCFPKAIRHYVRERQLMSLPEMVRKMTSLPADILGLSDRGRLQENAIADIVVFDAEKITDTATYVAPRTYAEGVMYLFVNGRLVIDHSQQTDLLPGSFVST